MAETAKPIITKLINR